MHRSLPVLSALLALSCGNTARPDFVVHLVDTQHGNPFARCDSGMVRVDVQQDTNALLTSNANITGTGMISSLAVEIPSYGLTTQIGVTVTCTGRDGALTLIGATPHFIPVGYGFVNVVLGEPRHCETLSSPSLAQTRVGPHLVRLHANVIVLGGLEGAEGVPSTHVQALDSVTLTTNVAASQFDALGIGIGLGHAVVLDATRMVFASDSLTGIFDASPTATAPLTTLSHSGGSEAAVVELSGNGVAIVGGAIGGDATPQVMWVLPNGSTVETQLLHPRRAPGAALVGNRLLVVGGQAPGEPLFELAPLMGDSVIAFGPTSEQRYGAVVVSDRTRARVFVGLGTDAADGGAPIDSTWALSSCAAAGCSFAPGPTLADPRTGVAVVPHVVGEVGGGEDYEILLLGGADTAGTASMLVDRVRFESDGTVSVAAAGAPPAGLLDTPRTHAGATEIGGGVVLVAGGRDDRGDALQSLEVCFPEYLRPVGPE